MFARLVSVSQASRSASHARGRAEAVLDVAKDPELNPASLQPEEARAFRGRLHAPSMTIGLAIWSFAHRFGFAWVARFALGWFGGTAINTPCTWRLTTPPDAHS